MDYERAAAEVRAALPDVTAIYLFGSRAHGGARPDSDVDLAVLCSRPIAPLVRWKLQGRLAGLFHVDVDLVDLATASTVMRAQIVDGSSVLFERDATARATFEAGALAAYARLNEERRGILEDIRASGLVHG